MDALASLIFMLSRPDVVVLGGGGVLGEAWMMGVLAGIEEATGLDLRSCEHFVGTSAGSIVAAHLAAGRAPPRPGTREQEQSGADDDRAPASSLASAARSAARSAGRLAFAASAPLVPLALRAARPGGAAVRAAVLSRVPRPRNTLESLRAGVERSGARFDGRLRIVAVDRQTGRRVVFGAPSAPHATVAEAVQASCTVPWLFAPVVINGREYVDGGVWSPTNLDVPPVGRETYVLCLNPTAGIAGAHPLFGVVRGVSRSASSLEAMALRRRGAIVDTFGPDARAAVAMGANLMNPAPRERVLASGYRQGLEMAARDARDAPPFTARRLRPPERPPGPPLARRRGAGA